MSFGAHFDTTPSFPPLSHLYFGYHFNQPLYELPISLTSLEFGSLFNKPIDLTCNTNLTHLIFGYFFNQPIDGLLPNSVTHLHFGPQFNHPLDKLPQNLTHLMFAEFNTQQLNKLPSSLLSFIAVRCKQQLQAQLPPKITHLRASIGIDRALPSSITYLETDTLSSLPNWLPSTLTHLCIDGKLSISPHFPESITHLSIRSVTDTEIIPCLPQNLFFLELDTNYATLSFPQSLQILKISTVAVHPLPPPPPNITHLWLDALPSTIPTSVTHLVTCAQHLHVLLPSSITHLGLLFKGPSSPQINQFLPPSLLLLFLEGAYYDYPHNYPDSIVVLSVATRRAFTKLPKSLKVLIHKSDPVKVPEGHPHVQQWPSNRSNLQREMFNFPTIYSSVDWKTNSSFCLKEFDPAYL